MSLPAAATPAWHVRDLRAPILVGALGSGAALLLHGRDPHDAGSYGACPFLLLTGRPCPACGGLRAVNDLTRGDVVAALSSNLLVVALVLVLAGAWARWVVVRARGRGGPMIVVGPRASWALLVLVVAFGVVRNTPWGAWLAP